MPPTKLRPRPWIWARGLARGLAMFLLAGGRVALAASPAPQAPSSAALEYEVKSAFLYNFAKFTEWPPLAPARTRPTFDLCVLGEDPFGDALDRVVKGLQVGGRPVAIRRIAQANKAGACAMVFVSSSESSRLQDDFASLRGFPVLTVGESAGFASVGGMIGLLVEDARVRFEINQEAVTAAGLKLSSQLLRLARLVRTRAADRTK
jgi:hypothetical protein